MRNRPENRQKNTPLVLDEELKKSKATQEDKSMTLDKLQSRLVFFCVLVQDLAFLEKSDQVPVCYILWKVSRSNL